MEHFQDYPVNRGYNVCTCDCCGEEIYPIECQITRQEGKEKWWHLFAKLTLLFFPIGEIESGFYEP